MIYTSYFKKIINHPLVISGKLKPMSIAFKAPPWFPIDNHITMLKPPGYLVSKFKKSEINRSQYDSFYFSTILENLNPNLLIDAYDNCVLCCWHKNHPCHRFIVTQWIKEKTGFTIPELAGETISPDNTLQLDLFDEKQNI